MSAERLRRAAEVLRDRANRARAGQWVASGYDVLANWDSGDRLVASTVEGSPCEEGRAANAMFIATFDPGVALAVADWLDETSLRTQVAGTSGAWTGADKALAAADAILAGVES